MTFRELYALINQELKNYYPETEIEAFIQIISKTLFGFSRIEGILHASQQVPESSGNQIYNIIQKLKRNTPIQYIFEETEFYGLQFFVSPDVLIPRPETEELAEWIITDNKQNKNISVIDIGTGSGCIPIVLAKHLKDAEVWAVDISSDALKIAEKNALENEVSVQFVQMDILKDPVPFTNKFDVIVSNPPYVTLAQKKLMHPNVLEFEPHLALFVANDDPLIFYKAITKFAQIHLKAGGAVYFEINENYSHETTEMIEEFGFKCELRKDINGKFRMIKAIRK